MRGISMPAKVRFTVVADDTGVRVALTLVLGESTYVLPFERDEANELQETLSTALRALGGIEEAIEEEEPAAKC